MLMYYWKKVTLVRLCYEIEKISSENNFRDESETHLTFSFSKLLIYNYLIINDKMY